METFIYKSSTSEPVTPGEILEVGWGRARRLSVSTDRLSCSLFGGERLLPRLVHSDPLKFPTWIANLDPDRKTQPRVLPRKAVKVVSEKFS